MFFNGQTSRRSPISERLRLQHRTVSRPVSRQGVSSGQHDVGIAESWQLTLGLGTA